MSDPNVLVGAGTADDAAIYRVSDELALIKTVDFFTPVVDDPYLFGAIAAANSLSDVYAMGGKPALALNIVGFPRANKDVPLSILAEILKGGADKAREAGIDIVGGHSVDDAEPKYGLCVTGFVHPDDFWTNVGARPGDVLILTKPIGLGVITTAQRADSCPPEVMARAITVMATLNRAACEAARALEKDSGARVIQACTDVTGFGLFGHLKEMLGSEDGQSRGVHIRAAAVPLIEGARALAEDGFVPGGSKRNKATLDEHVTYDEDVAEVDRLLFCDAQTSGGLLMAVAPEQRDALLGQLTKAGVEAAEIGTFEDAPQPRIRVTAE